MEFISSGGTISDGTVISGGTITISSGGNVLDGLTISGGTAYFAGAQPSTQTVSFTGSNGDLVIGNQAAFQAAIGGFGKDDKIDLITFTYRNNAAATFTEAPSNTSGTLTVPNGTGQTQLTLLGSYVTSNFTLSVDSGHGTLVTFNT